MSYYAGKRWDSCALEGRAFAPFVESRGVGCAGEFAAVSSGVRTYRPEAPTGDGYRPQAPFLDELFDNDGTPRSTAQALVEELRRLGPEGLIEAGRRRDAI